MFDLPDLKSFKDSVHGYINIPKIFISNIVDTPGFQRLRNIEQTGMKVLYPTAKHDRFSHSIGVFHLGSIAVDALMDNFRGESHWKVVSDGTNEIFWAKNKVLFLIACLLHDIGHAPFSHSLERFFGFEPFESTGSADSSFDELQKMLFGNDNTTEDEKGFFRQSSEHEKMSAWLLLDKNCLWYERIEAILNELGKKKFPERILESDGEYDQDPPCISADNLEEDVQFIARMILGVKYSDYKPEKQIRNCFIELLNGSFDVDKLDYTVRDTKMSGIRNIALDIERLLSSLTIIPKTIYEKSRFKLDKPDHHTIITKIDYGEKKPLCLTKAKLDRQLTISNCTVTFPEHTRLKLKPIGSGEKRGITVETPGAEVDASSGAEVGEEPVIIVNNDRHSPIKGRFSIPHDEDMRLELSVKVVCPEIKMEISKDQFYLLSVDSRDANEPVKINGTLLDKESLGFVGEIDGYAKYLEVLSDELVANDLLPTKNRYTGFSLGFKKQAVNLLSNVTDARNYLYLWIYSHHKVIYYANYLIVELSRLSIPLVDTDDTGDPCETLNSKMINMLICKDKNDEQYMLDEIFINSRIRAAFEHTNCSEYKALFKEYSSRRYRKSLYKSLVEFDLVFEQFSDESKKHIKSELEKISNVLAEESPPCEILGDEPSQLSQRKMFITKLKYGKIMPQYLKEMKAKKKSLNIIVEISLDTIIEDLIWVESKPSLKRPPASSVLISFGNSRNPLVTTMDRLPLLEANDLKAEQSYYFYLYYREKNPEKLGSVNVKSEEVRDIIKKAFIEYMKGKL